MIQLVIILSGFQLIDCIGFYAVSAIFQRFSKIIFQLIKAYTKFAPPPKKSQSFLAHLS